LPIGTASRSRHPSSAWQAQPPQAELSTSIRTPRVSTHPTVVLDQTDVQERLLSKKSVRSNGDEMRCRACKGSTTCQSMRNVMLVSAHSAATAGSNWDSQAGVLIQSVQGERLPIAKFPARKARVAMGTRMRLGIPACVRNAITVGSNKAHLIDVSISGAPGPRSSTEKFRAQLPLRLSHEGALKLLPKPPSSEARVR
jgi:hypothetical protein